MAQSNKDKRNSSFDLEDYSDENDAQGPIDIKESPRETGSFWSSRQLQHAMQGVRSEIKKQVGKNVEAKWNNQLVFIAADGTQQCCQTHDHTPNPFAYPTARALTAGQASRSPGPNASPERAPFGIPPGHRRVPIAPKPAPSPSESAEDNLSDTQVGPHQIPDLRKRRSERTRRVAGTPGYPEVRPTASYNSKITAEDSALLLDLKENYNLSWSVPYLTQQALLLVRANHNRPRDWVLGLTPPTETAKPLADNAWNRQQIADFLPGRSRQTLQVYHATKLKNRGKSLTDGQVQELLRAEEEADMKKWRAIAVKMKITVEEAKTMWTEAQEKRAAQAGRGGSSDGREDVS